LRRWDHTIVGTYSGGFRSVLAGVAEKTGLLVDTLVIIRLDDLVQY
jgi:hypothetical protein